MGKFKPKKVVDKVRPPRAPLPSSSREGQASAGSMGAAGAGAEVDLVGAEREKQAAAVF